MPGLETDTCTGGAQNIKVKSKDKEKEKEKKSDPDKVKSGFKGLRKII